MEIYGNCSSIARIENATELYFNKEFYCQRYPFRNIITRIWLRVQMRWIFWLALENRAASRFYYSERCCWLCVCSCVYYVFMELEAEMHLPVVYGVYIYDQGLSFCSRTCAQIYGRVNNSEGIMHKQNGWY